MGSQYSCYRPPKWRLVVDLCRDSIWYGQQQIAIYSTAGHLHTWYYILQGRIQCYGEVSCPPTKSRTANTCWGGETAWLVEQGRESVATTVNCYLNTNPSMDRAINSVERAAMGAASVSICVADRPNVGRFGITALLQEVDMYSVTTTVDCCLYTNP